MVGKKGSIPSIGPGAGPGVQAVSPQVTISHPPGGRLPFLSARPAVTFPAKVVCLQKFTHLSTNLSYFVDLCSAVTSKSNLHH